MTGEPSGGERQRRSGRRYADLSWTVPGSLCKPETFCSVLVSLSLCVAQAVKESVHLPAMRNPRFNPWVGKIPWRRERQPNSIFLPGEFHGQRSLAGYSPWGCKELDMTEQLAFIQRWQKSYFRNVQPELSAILSSQTGLPPCFLHL